MTPTASIASSPNTADSPTQKTALEPSQLTTQAKTQTRTQTQTEPQTEISGRTPAGLQSVRCLMLRRAVFAALCLLTIVVVAWAAASVLGDAVWTPIDMVLFATILLTAPWTIISFWTAVIGLCLRHAGRAGLRLSAPHLASVDADAAIQSRVALAMAVRNEDPERAYRRLLSLRRSLEAEGIGANFDVFILSDTADAALADREERLFAAIHADLAGSGAAIYRRRDANVDFKAGNIRDFLNRWGDDYAYFVPLDADSLMSGGAVALLTRIAERHPQIGIVQSAILGAPSNSAFARLFQFGLRQSQLAMAMGSAWWQGDHGPYWGHNAVIRVDAFKAHCQLPHLPGPPPLGGPVLSHDQVEAGYMRRAGYEVRVVPIETESFEDMPVTLLDFFKREQRWCTGNMQYGPFVRRSGLRPISRIQLGLAMLAYIAPAAWMAMTVIGALKIWEAPLYPQDGFDAALALGLFAAMMTMSFWPKITGWIDAALTPGRVAAQGGPGRFAMSALAETLFAMLAAPAVAWHLTMVQIGLLFSRRIGWDGQDRDAHGIAWATAFASCRGQLLVGVALATTLSLYAPGVLPWAAPVLAGLVLAPAVAVATASPELGRWMRRRALAATPEDRAPTPVLRDVAQRAPMAALASDRLIVAE